ncbi:MAG: glutamate--tRNA ligase [Alphaproteobacteria bacterium]|nr:MAG: glutamate--tRNA ligase [Alphaproteobacteria bacterium]
MSNKVRLRFAPSPTGRLHLGNARAAVVNYLFAKSKGGEFMLRIDDTDLERSTREFEDGIYADLKWLGLNWDLTAKQSERMGRYAEVFEILKKAGRLYPCYETAEELDMKRKIQLSRGKPPIYDRGALKLTEEEKQKFESEGRKPHWRFLLNHNEIAWDDIIRGMNHFHGENLTDPILYRADKGPVYMLASVVDDGDFAISHIVRGEDHVANTAVQIQIFAALGFTPPQFAHFSLITDASGEGFSKRTGSLSLGTLRDEGIEPMAINSMMAKLGTSEPVEPKLTLQELAQGYELSIFGRAQPKLDKADLLTINMKLLHHMPYSMAVEKLRANNLPEVGEAFWNAVRGNINNLREIADWYNVCHQPIQPVIKDAGFAAEAAKLLPPEPWSTETWSKLVDSVKGATGRKGKELFMPLRLALTGREHGPELANILPFIGRAKAEKRLQGQAA